MLLQRIAFVIYVWFVVGRGCAMNARPEFNIRIFLYLKIWIPLLSRISFSFYFLCIWCVNAGIRSVLLSDISSFTVPAAFYVLQFIHCAVCIVKNVVAFVSVESNDKMAWYVHIKGRINIMRQICRSHSLTYSFLSCTAFQVFVCVCIGTCVHLKQHIVNDDAAIEEYVAGLSAIVIM